MSNKTTPTDKVRAALEAANRCIENGPDYTILEGSAYHKMIRQALSELSGKVLVPVEPTKKDLSIEAWLAYKQTMIQYGPCDFLSLDEWRKQNDE